MLSRIASNLYWMARHFERAENFARILDVTYRMSLVPQESMSVNQKWVAPLLTTGLYRDFAKKYADSTPRDVLHFMVLDQENPSAICTTLQNARQNGRAVRSAISSEMWEALNSTWLEIREVSEADLENDGITRFFDRVKTCSHLFRGVTFGTMLHDEAFHFLRLGTYVERADNTARILDAKYHVLLPSAEDVGGAADYYQWGAVLRSVSAFEAYRKIYRDIVSPRRVAELLILCDDMPRSMHTCVNEIYELLKLVGGNADREPNRLAGDLHARLHYGRIGDIFKHGLHEYLTEFLQRIAALGDEINREYLWPEAEAQTPVTMSQSQGQRSTRKRRKTRQR